MKDTQHASVKERVFGVVPSPHHDIRVTVRVDTVLIAAHIIGVEVYTHGLVFINAIMEDAHRAYFAEDEITGFVVVIPRPETAEEVCFEVNIEVLFATE